MQAIDPAINGMAATALALIFGASGAVKLRDLELFEGAVANYQLLPVWLERPFARLIPVAEFSAAAALLFPATRSAAALALVVLLAMFTGAVAINLLRGRTNIDCGCFGPLLRQELSGWLLLRNASLMGLAAILMLPRTVRATQLIDAVTVGLGAATVVVLYLSANFAIGNAPKTRALETL